MTSSGARVVLLHSSGLSGRQWRRLAAALELRGCSADVPDFAGHGASTPVSEPTPFTFRDDVDALVARLRSGPAAHVVGHSYGGLVALLAALESPESVRSLVVYDPVAFGCLDPVLDADARSALGRVDRPWGTTPADHEGWLTSFVEFWGGEGAWAALREEARAGFRRAGWVVHEGVRTLGLDRTPASAYRSLDRPTRLIVGERSPLAAQRVAERLAENLPASRLVTIPGAGHMGPLTHADLVNQVVLDAVAGMPTA